MVLSLSPTRRQRCYIPTLRELHRRAISIESIAEFQQLLRDPDRLSS